MTITQKVAEKELLKLIKSKNLIYKTWLGKKFEAMKLSATTEKGNLAENFLAELMRSLGYSDVEVKPGRRGDYDVRVGIGTNEARLEVKLATQDTTNNFQFNGIRYDTDYTHLFCLGVTRSTIRYMIIPKEWLTTKKKEYHLVAMARSTNATFKLTRSFSDMLGFDKFESDVRELIEKPISD